MAKAYVGGYTTAEVGKLLGLSASQIRDWVRSGFLSPRRGGRGEHRFSLQDLVLLRTAKALARNIPARRVRRALRRLKEQLPSDRPLSAVRVTAQGDEVVVHEGRTAWAPESGQRLLDFDVADLAREVAPLARRRAAEARTVEGELDADDWFELACDLEPCDPGQARDAYRRALEMEPNHVAARVNLGRLLHDAGQTRAAETHYRLALAADPANAIAAFNLGVALEDLGRPDEAVEAYEQALVADASLCDAHYNLSRLFERAGRASAAFRHLKAYKQLTDER